MKKPHPADIAAEQAMIVAIKGADHFMASIFRGAGVYEKQEAPTVRAARKQAALMQAGRPTRALIYAIGKDGRATLLTDALIDKLFAAYPG